MWICGYTNSEACVPSGNYRMLEVNQRGNDEEEDILRFCLYMLEINN